MYKPKSLIREKAGRKPKRKLEAVEKQGSTPLAIILYCINLSGRVCCLYLQNFILPRHLDSFLGWIYLNEVLI